MEDIVKISEELEDKVMEVIKEFQANHKSEIHSVICYAYFSPVSKKVEFALKSDVREPGQLFFGISS